MISTLWKDRSMRKYGLALLLALLPFSTAHAGNAGLYVGIAGGWGQFDVNTSYNIDNPEANFSLFDNTQTDRDFFSQIRVGYANGYKFENRFKHFWERFHWAAEIFVEPMSHSLTETSNTTGASIAYHMKTNYGALLKPGLQTTLNTTLQLHIGIVKAQFNSIDTNTGDSLLNEQGHYSKVDTGVRVGLGFEGRFTRHWAAEVSVTRTIFSGKHAQRTLIPPIYDGITTFYLENLKFTPQIDQIMLNVSYYLVH